MFRLTLLLIAACAAAILSAHLIGNTRPNPLAILFANPDGTPYQRPCLLGVRPGVTKYEDAVMLLRTHPLIQQLDHQEGTPYTLTFSGSEMRIQLYKVKVNSSTPQSLSTYFLSPSTAPYYGDLLNILGTPTSFSLEGNLECEAYFLYKNQKVMPPSSYHPDTDKGRQLAYIILAADGIISSHLSPCPLTP